MLDRGVLNRYETEHEILGGRANEYDRGKTGKNYKVYGVGF